MIMKEFLFITWCISNNVGDALSSWLVKKITNKIPIYVEPAWKGKKYMCVGSILNWAGEGTIVWGTGIANKSDCVSLGLDIKAVRGPISRRRAIKCGVLCPKVYGDPALLLPKFFNPSVEKKYELGIIPHFTDQFYIISNKIIHRDDVNFIDVFRTVEEFVCEIKSCEYIISSSLHGLIIAQIYGIPAMWFQTINRIGGDGTKFHDYFLSTNQKIVRPREWCEICDLDIKVLCNEIHQPELNIDLDLLWEVCPFRKK